MNTTFYLIRHRESEKNILEIHHSKWTTKYPLTERWFLQSEKLVTLLAWKIIDVIYTSPFLRCIQTITPLSENRGITPIIDNRITEFDVGNLDETPWELSWTSERKLTDTLWWETGESLRTCQKRMYDFLDEMKMKHAGKNIAICSHGELWLFARQYFLGFDYDDATSRDPQYPEKDGYDEYVIHHMTWLLSYEVFTGSKI